MLERDGKIEESLARGSNLQVASNSYKNRSTSLNRNLRWRYYCYRISIALIAILLIVLISLWISGKFSSS